MNELEVGNHVAQAIVILARVARQLKQRKNKDEINEAIRELRIAIGVETEETKK